MAICIKNKPFQFFILICFIFLQCKSQKLPDWIKNKPIIFNSQRIELTKEYAKIHYGNELIHIVPQIIVIHWTAIPSLKESFDTFNPVKIHNRPYIDRYGRVNVSCHYLVDRDGTIYKLMPDTLMARHVIGLNHCSIGIENVGSFNLTTAQLQANVNLVRYLAKKYPSIKYLIGHYEYEKFKGSDLFIKKIPGYRTVKIDPGKMFMQKLRYSLKDLHLNEPNGIH